MDSEENAADLQWAEEEIQAIETDELIRRATRQLIEIPWSEVTHGGSGERYLNYSARLALARTVRDERRKGWEWVGKSIVPILSLAVALVAILTGHCK